MILPSPLALKIGVALALLSLLGTVLPAAGWACVGALVALALGVWIDGASLPAGCVRFERAAPKRLSLGEPEPLDDRLENRTGSTLLVEWRDAPPAELRLAPERRAPLRLEPRQALVVRSQATATRRGARLLPAPVLRVGRPAGLALRQWPEPGETRLLVSPNVERLRRYEVLRQRRALQGFGVHVARQAGLGSEFDHLRHYTPGDDVRRIHWKATARRGTPVSQVVRLERDQSVIVAVDVSHWMGVAAGDLTRLDYAVDAALFLAHVARRGGDRVGLALFGHELLALLPPSAQPGQAQRLLDALSAAEPRPVHASYRNLARGLLARRLRRSLLVVLSEPVDEEAGEELRRALVALQGRHVPLAVSFQDPALQATLGAVPADVPALCQRLAAGEVAEARAERLRRLQQHGLASLDVLPRDLAVSLVNRYLALKERRAL